MTLINLLDYINNSYSEARYHALIFFYKSLKEYGIRQKNELLKNSNYIWNTLIEVATIEFQNVVETLINHLEFLCIPKPKNWIFMITNQYVPLNKEASLFFIRLFDMERRIILQNTLNTQRNVNNIIEKLFHAKFVIENRIETMESYRYDLEEF